MLQGSGGGASMVRCSCAGSTGGAGATGSTGETGFTGFTGAAQPLLIYTPMIPLLYGCQTRPSFCPSLADTMNSV